jgi:hypothetical protein
MSDHSSKGLETEIVNDNKSQRLINDIGPTSVFRSYSKVLVNESQSSRDEMYRQELLREIEILFALRKQLHAERDEMLLQKKEICFEIEFLKDQTKKLKQDIRDITNHWEI